MAHHGLPFTSSVLFAIGAGTLTSFFHAQKPSLLDHELSAGAEAMASAFVACTCSGAGEAAPLVAMRAGLAVLEAAISASSLSKVLVIVKAGEGDQCFRYRWYSSSSLAIFCFFNSPSNVATPIDTPITAAKATGRIRPAILPSYCVN